MLLLAVGLSLQAVVGEDATLHPLHWLARHQAEDGSWGPRVRGCT